MLLVLNQLNQKKRMLQFKSTLAILIYFITILSCQSQVTVTKEFDNNEYICSYHHFEGVNLYATFDTDNNEIKIYNYDHQLQTSLIHDAENYYNSIYIYGLSKDVFNSDGNIEFLIHKIGTDGNTSKIVLTNDQNETLQEFLPATILRTIGNKNYIVESTTETIVDKIKMNAELKKTDKLYEIKGKFRRLIF